MSIDYKRRSKARYISDVSDHEVSQKDIHIKKLQKTIAKLENERKSGNTLSYNILSKMDPALKEEIKMVKYDEEKQRKEASSR